MFASKKTLVLLGAVAANVASATVVSAESLLRKKTTRSDVKATEAAAGEEEEASLMQVTPDDFAELQSAMLGTSFVQKMLTHAKKAHVAAKADGDDEGESTDMMTGLKDMGMAMAKIMFETFQPQMQEFLHKQLKAMDSDDDGKLEMNSRLVPGFEFMKVIVDMMNKELQSWEAESS
ncbi:unnamed protein product [Amoebophrya sp. A120]|nr:unnamed protein product [Amoebophrya sp. A120]|eukprot:GSA120T00020650001.1